MVNATPWCFTVRRICPLWNFELRFPIGLDSVVALAPPIVLALLQLHYAFNAIFIITFTVSLGIDVYSCIHRTYSCFDPKLFPFHSRDSLDAFTYVINMSLFQRTEFILFISVMRCSSKNYDVLWETKPYRWISVIFVQVTLPGYSDLLMNS